MTLNISDIKHLEVMAALASKRISPEEAAEGMLDRYSSPKAALEAAHWQKMDYLARKNKEEIDNYNYWDAVCSLVKEHSTKKDSGDSFDQNVLSLAKKLHESGFSKYANELEEKFLNYKAAGTHLYRAIDEDGEDLLHAAHPEGSNELCDASNGNGVVEDLLDRQKKIQEVVNKKPTGKLAEVVRQCKVVLGLDHETLNSASFYVEKAVEDTIAATNKIINDSNVSLLGKAKLTNKLDTIKELSRPIDTRNLLKIKHELDKLIVFLGSFNKVFYQRLLHEAPTLFASGPLSPIFFDAQKFLGSVSNLIAGGSEVNEKLLDDCKLSLQGAKLDIDNALKDLAENSMSENPSKQEVVQLEDVAKFLVQKQSELGNLTNINKNFMKPVVAFVDDIDLLLDRTNSLREKRKVGTITELVIGTVHFSTITSFESLKKSVNDTIADIENKIKK